jgi:2-dehydro-3-deoxyphosphogalactonate aldolase
MTLDEALAGGAPPIVAILRGVTPAEAGAIGAALVDAGIAMIEIPLNSPDPFTGIAALVAEVGERALCGAGTVLSPTSVEEVHAAGGRLVVTPNTDPDVIARAVSLGLEAMPGFVTPSEAFAALAAGARRLKLFPAGGLSSRYLKAVREVLPQGTGLWAVGGTNGDTLGEWLDAGAEGIGVGGALYRPGDKAEDVGARAAVLVAAWRAYRDDAQREGPR